MNVHTVIDQLRDWADALERGDIEGLIRGMREVAADIEREDEASGLNVDERMTAMSGRKIHAIKMLRERTRQGLKECHAAVTAFMESSVTSYKLIARSDVDYELEKGASVWITVRNLSLHINDTGEGVACDIYSREMESLDDAHIAGTWALFQEAEPALPAVPLEQRCDPSCPGWVTTAEGGIEKCDDCGRFASDEEAFLHVLSLRLEDAKNVPISGVQEEE